jgi:hypothetical protein
VSAVADAPACSYWQHLWHRVSDRRRLQLPRAQHSRRRGCCRRGNVLLTTAASGVLRSIPRKRLHGPAQPQDIAARPAPPPQAFELSDGSGMAAPDLHYDESKRYRYAEMQMFYQLNYQYNLAPQMARACDLRECGLAPSCKRCGRRRHLH